MPSFFVWTPGDFGTTGYSTSGTFTMSGTPDVIDVTDDDSIFHDSPSDSSSSTEIGGPQTLTVDLILDGSIAVTAGEEVYNAAEATITNSTTGEVGRLIYITSGDSGSGTGFFGYASTININPGDVFTISALDISTEEAYANLVICFARGTLIKTNDGEKPIESLVVGDFVETMDNGFQPIRWLGCRTLSISELMNKPSLRPIRIKAGALADGVPHRNLVVSPQHRILVRSKIAKRMFAKTEVFVAAKHLIGLAGVEIAKDLQSVTYFHAMCDNHEILMANGACAETLYTGSEAMKAMTAAAKNEIDEIFGETPYLNRPLARPAPKGQLAKRLVERHIKNDRDMLQSV